MPATAQPARPAHTVGLVPVATLILWTGCLLVGTLGFTLPYKRPRAPAILPPPVTAQKIAVELEQSPRQPNVIPKQPVSPLPAPPPAPAIAVSAPSPALAFTLPVLGPVRVVADAKASSSIQATAPSSHPPVQPLVFGRGEGRQPAPSYPSAAIRQAQEGTVTVLLNVDEDGHVISAEASAPSPWPLLNEAAIRTVRERWHFPPGAPRSYEVAVRFTLKK